MRRGPTVRLAAVACAVGTLASCVSFSVELEDRPCGAEGDPCVDGWICHPELGRCVPAIPLGCGGDTATCPEATVTGAPCPVEGAFVPCSSLAVGCELGCRTCNPNLAWSDCSTPPCVLGSLASCSACGDDCRAQVQNATPVCTPGAEPRCAYEGPCFLGSADRDGDPGNGCECQVAAETCNQLDDDCDGAVDEAEDRPCGPGAACEEGACVPCADDDPMRCGSACAVCADDHPICAEGACRCDEGSCGEGRHCDGTSCLPCEDDDPDHCGPSCLSCGGETPACSAGMCVCDADSCGEDAACLGGTCVVRTTLSTLSVSPRRLPADGEQVAVVTVELVDDATGDPIPDATVVVTSSRPGVDLIATPPPTNDKGKTSTTLRSGVPGWTRVEAWSPSELLSLADQATVFFGPATGQVAYYPFDAPTGRPLVAGDLGGVAGTLLRNAWHLDEAEDEAEVLDEAGTHPFTIGLPATFDAGIKAPWFGFGHLFQADTQHTGAVVDGSDMGGTVDVYGEDGQVRIEATSNGSAGRDGHYEASVRLAQDLDHMSPAFDVEVSYEMLAITGQPVRYNLPVRLLVVLGTTAHVAVEIFVDASGRWLRGYLFDGAVQAGTPVPNPPTSGKLRVARVGNTVRAWYWTGSWVEVLTTTSAAPAATAVIVAAYVHARDAVGMGARIDDVLMRHAPARVRPGLLGRALSFDGSGTGVGVIGPAHTLTNALTMEAWFRSPGGGLNFPRVVELSTGGGVDTHAIAYNTDGRLRAWVQCATPSRRSVELSPAALLIDDRWHHAALVFGAGQVRLYLDGGEVASEAEACTDLLDPTHVVLGNHFNRAHPFLGEIDEVAVFNAALTPAQVADHHGRGIAPDLLGGPAGRLEGATSVAGVWAEGLALTQSDRVVLPAPLLDGGGPRTLSLWMAAPSPASVGLADIEVLSSFDAAGSGWRLGVSGSGRPFAVLSDGISSVRVEATSAMTPQSWHHVALWLDADALCVALDAASSCLTHGLGDPAAGTETVVAGPASVDELEVYDRVLTAAELAALASAP